MVLNIENAVSKVSRLESFDSDSTEMLPVLTKRFKKKKKLLMCVIYKLCEDLPQWIRIRDGFGRRHLPAVRHTSRPGDWHVLTRQHHMRHIVGGVLKQRSIDVRRLRRFQLQRLGHFETRQGW